MAKIHAGVSELRVAYGHLVAASRNGTGTPAHLLLFYAVECGLKSACLRRNKLRTTESLKTTNHDLHSLIKELKLPAAAISAPPVLRLSGHKSEICPHSDAHQAWRYGVRIENADQAKFVGWLNVICEVLKEHL
jgi:hypothetical protein